VATWDDVVSIGQRLPSVEAGSWCGTPGLLVGKKGFRRLRTNPDALVIRVADLDDRDAWRLTAPQASPRPARTSIAN
jgi:hypothetical protein